MSRIDLAFDGKLFVAGRGSHSSHGLYEWTESGGEWRGAHIAAVEQLAALVEHPRLPIVYGVSGTGDEGWLHAWTVQSGAAENIGTISSGGLSPCHLAIDPSGNWLVATNYRTSTLAVQRLAMDGRFDWDVALVTMTGSGPDPERQEAAHPHQALFVGYRLFVIDLGADLLREFVFDAESHLPSPLRPLRETSLPAGTGPRHGVLLPDGRFAISGELGSSLVVGLPGTSAKDWAIRSSTQRTGPAKTRSERNYPGDIRRSEDGRFVYFANRGHDTISTFDVGGRHPALVGEIEAGVSWPQHLLVLRDHLLIAGWDSSQVVSMPLDKGLPTPARPLFECSGAGWLLMSNKRPF